MVSIIELVVYGMITYGTLLFIILTSMNKIDLKHDYSMLRLAFVMPAMILSLVLGGISSDVVLFEESISTTNGTIVTTSETKMVIENSIWFYVHLIIFFMLFFYGLLNAFGTLLKK